MVNAKISAANHGLTVGETVHFPPETFIGNLVRWAKSREIWRVTEVDSVSFTLESAGRETIWMRVKEWFKHKFKPNTN